MEAWHFSCHFFFFQAEDGIRDYKVTGVQTCALPICRDGGGEKTLFHDGFSWGWVDRNEDSRSAAQCRPRWRSHAAAKGEESECAAASTASMSRWSCGVEAPAKASVAAPRSRSNRRLPRRDW